jgi:hypothetical protein
VTDNRILEKFLSINHIVAHVKKGPRGEAVFYSEGRKNHVRILRRRRRWRLEDFRDKWGGGGFSCLITRRRCAAVTYVEMFSIHVTHKLSCVCCVCRDSKHTKIRTSNSIGCQIQ